MQAKGRRVAWALGHERETAAQAMCVTEFAGAMLIRCLGIRLLGGFIFATLHAQ